MTPSLPACFALRRVCLTFRSGRSPKQTPPAETTPGATACSPSGTQFGVTFVLVGRSKRLLPAPAPRGADPQAPPVERTPEAGTRQRQALLPGPQADGSVPQPRTASPGSAGHGPYGRLGGPRGSAPRTGRPGQQQGQRNKAGPPQRGAGGVQAGRTPVPTKPVAGAMRQTPPEAGSEETTISLPPGAGSPLRAGKGRRTPLGHGSPRIILGKGRPSCLATEPITAGGTERQEAPRRPAALHLPCKRRRRCRCRCAG